MYGAHCSSIIPPPFPDPSKWNAIREQQTYHDKSQWLTSSNKNKGYFPFPPNLINMSPKYGSYDVPEQHRYEPNTFNNIHDKNVKIDRNNDQSDRIITDHNDNKESHYKYVNYNDSKKTNDHDSDSNDNTNDEVNNGNHEYPSYSTEDPAVHNGKDMDTNRLQELQSDIDISSRFKEGEEGEEGEEVEVFQVDDFWIKRLAQTVKRMKKKNKKSFNR